MSIKIPMKEKTMKNRKNGNEFFRPEVHKDLQKLLRELSTKSHIELRMMLSAALQNFVDARKNLFSELENKKEQ